MGGRYYRVEFSNTASQTTFNSARERATMLAEQGGASFHGNSGERSGSLILFSDSKVSDDDFASIPGVSSVKLIKPTH